MFAARDRALTSVPTPAHLSTIRRGNERVVPTHFAEQRAADPRRRHFITEDALGPNVIHDQLAVDGNALVPVWRLAGIIRGAHSMVLDVPRGGERCR